MPPPPSLQVAVEPERLVRELIDAHVLDDMAVAPHVTTFEAAGSKGGSTALAAIFVKAGLLTRYQADRAVNGEAAKLTMGPYTLQEPIGSGSLGTVYRAIRRSDSKLFAVKVLPLRSLWNVHLAKKQSQIFAKLPPHRAIVPFVDIDSAGISHYLVWPFVQGETLDDRIQRLGPLPPVEAVRIMAEIADGLAGCHQKGIIHGLIKPANILVTSDDQPKLLDIGIGAILTENLADGESLLDTISTTSTMVGMIDCAAPETLHQPNLRNAAGDAYGFGCVLYYLLTGVVPFPDGTVVHKMIAHQTQEPMQVRARNPNVPPGLARITEQLLGKKPDDRPRNMSSVRDTLLQSLPDPSRRPVSTGPMAEAVRNPVPPSGFFPSRPTTPAPNTDTAPPPANYDGSEESIDFDVATITPKKETGSVDRDSPRAGIFQKPQAILPPAPEPPAPLPPSLPAAPPPFRLQPLLKSKADVKPPSYPATPRPTAPMIEPFSEQPPAPPPPLSTQPRLGNRSSWFSPPKPTTPSNDWGDVEPDLPANDSSPREYAPPEYTPREYTPAPAPLPPPRPQSFSSMPSHYSVPVPSYPPPAPPPAPALAGFGPSTYPMNASATGPERHGLTPVALGFGAQRRGMTPPVVGVPSTPGLPVQQYLEMPLAEDGPTLPRVVTPAAPNLVFSQYLWKAARLVCFWLPARDVVQVSVFGPPEWAAGQTVKLLVYVHERSSAAGLRTLSRTFRSESALLGTAYVDQLVIRGSTVGLHLSVVGGRVGRSLTGMVWAGEASPVEFDVFVPPVGPGGLTRAVLSIGLNGVKAGEVPFPAVIAQQR